MWAKYGQLLCNQHATDSFREGIQVSDKSEGRQESGKKRNSKPQTPNNSVEKEIYRAKKTEPATPVLSKTNAVKRTSAIVSASQKQEDKKTTSAAGDLENSRKKTGSTNKNAIEKDFQKIEAKEQEKIVPIHGEESASKAKIPNEMPVSVLEETNPQDTKHKDSEEYAIEDNGNESANNSSNPKSFFEQMKDFKEAIKIIGTIGSAIVLILSTFKIYAYNSFYGIPIMDLSDISMLYSVLANTIIIGFISFFIFLQIFFVHQNKNDDIEDSKSHANGTIVYIGLTAVVFIVMDFYYVFDSSLFMSLFGKMPAWIVIAIFIISLGFYCVSWYKVAAYYRQEGRLTKKESADLEKDELQEQLSAIKKKRKIFYTIAAIFTTVFFVSFIVVAFDKVFDDLIPVRIREQEIIYKDDQSYVVVCNSSNGKIIEKCDYYVEDKNNQASHLQK